MLHGSIFPHVRMSTLLESLNWRYATKKFDPTKKLSADQLHEIQETLRLSASSYGLQPSGFLIVNDPTVRANIQEHAWGQSQISDASHLIVLCARRTIDEAYIDSYIHTIAATRGMKPEDLAHFKGMMMSTVNGRTPADLAEWMKKQTYIALGFLLSAAAHLKIDACPMEGFDAAKVDQDVGLAAKNLTAVVLCPIGFRAADDETATYKKVRFPKEKLFIEL